MSAVTQFSSPSRNTSLPCEVKCDHAGSFSQHGIYNMGHFQAKALKGSRVSLYAPSHITASPESLLTLGLPQDQSIPASLSPSMGDSCPAQLLGSVVHLHMWEIKLFYLNHWIVELFVIAA